MSDLRCAHCQSSAAGKRSNWHDGAGRPSSGDNRPNRVTDSHKRSVQKSIPEGTVPSIPSLVAGFRLLGAMALLPKSAFLAICTTDPKVPPGRSSEQNERCEVCVRSVRATETDQGVSPSTASVSVYTYALCPPLEIRANTHTCAALSHSLSARRKHPPPRVRTPLALELMNDVMSHKLSILY